MSPLPPPTLAEFPRVAWVARGVELPLDTPLALGRSQNGTSREGIGLSVSLDPWFWHDLLGLPGPAWLLAHRDGSPFRFARWTGGLVDAALRWGADEGLCVRRAGAARRVEFQHRSGHAAEFAAADIVRDGRTYRIERDPELHRTFAERRAPRYGPTARLLYAWRAFFAGAPRLGWEVPARDLTDGEEAEVVNRFVAAHWPALDGVWRPRVGEPEAGVLLPETLGRAVAVRRLALAEIAPYAARLDTVWPGPPPRDVVGLPPGV